MVAYKNKGVMYMDIKEVRRQLRNEQADGVFGKSLMAAVFDLRTDKEGD